MYGFSVSEQCKWRLHVPRLQDGAEKSFKWPKERGSVINVTTQTKRVWHGTTLAAFWDIVRDGFLRNHRPPIDNGTGVWLAKEVIGCEYYSQGNNPRVRLQVEVPDPVSPRRGNRPSSARAPPRGNRRLFQRQLILILDQMCVSSSRK